MIVIRGLNEKKVLGSRDAGPGMVGSTKAGSRGVVRERGRGGMGGMRGRCRGCRSVGHLTPLHSDAAWVASALLVGVPSGKLLGVSSIGLRRGLGKMVLAHSQPLGCLLATCPPGVILFGGLGNGAAAPPDVVTLSDPLAPLPDADDEIEERMGVGSLLLFYWPVAAS